MNYPVACDKIRVFVAGKERRTQETPPDGSVELEIEMVKRQRPSGHASGSGMPQQHNTVVKQRLVETGHVNGFLPASLIMELIAAQITAEFLVAASGERAPADDASSLFHYPLLTALSDFCCKSNNLFSSEEPFPAEIPESRKNILEF